MQYLDKLGWPVERVKGRGVFNLLRLLVHTRKIKRGAFTRPEQGIQLKHTSEEKCPTQHHPT